MSKFEEYLEQTSKVKTKEIIGESYEASDFNNYNVITKDRKQTTSLEHKQIVELLNLIEKEGSGLKEWIEYLTKWTNGEFDIYKIDHLVNQQLRKIPYPTTMEVEI